MTKAIYANNKDCIGFYFRIRIMCRKKALDFCFLCLITVFRGKIKGKRVHQLHLKKLNIDNNNRCIRLARIYFQIFAIIGSCNIYFLWELTRLLCRKFIFSLLLL